MSEYNEQEIDLTPYVKKLVRHWKTVLLWAFVAAVIGFGVAKSIPKQYTVVSKVSPELSYRNNSLSSLASLAGVNLNTLNSTDALLPTVYPEIVNSIPFMTDLFDMPVEFTSRKETVDTTLYAYLKDYTKSPWWGAVVSAPFQLIDWFRGVVTGAKDDDSDGIVEVDKFKLTKAQYKVARAMCRNIKAQADKKTFVITLTTTMQDPVIAAQVSQAVIDHLKDFIADYRTGKAKIDLEYYQKMYDEAQSEYYAAQQKYSVYMDTHQGMVRQSALVEQQRLQNEMNLKYQLYNSLAQQVQQAEAKVQQETPVFADIIPPSVPVKKSKPITKTYMLIFFILGAFASCVYVLARKEDEAIEE